MAGRGGWLAAVLLCAAAGSAAQPSGFSIAVKGNLTSGSQIYPNLRAADAVARSQSVQLPSFFGVGLEARYVIEGTRVAVGLSADYLSTVEESSLPTPSGLSLPREDGYRVIPVELTGYFLIPAGGPDIGLFMGGGLGAYFGERVYRIAGQEAAVVDTRPGLGIHVLGGVSYHLSRRFGLMFEMKFRDLQFECTNQFPVATIPYRGGVVAVSPRPTESRINTDGVVFQLGVSFSL